MASLFNLESIRNKDKDSILSDIAEIISIVFDPLIVTLITLFLILSAINLSWLERLGWFLVFILLGILPTVVFILKEIKIGKIHDWFISKREERYKVVLVSILSMLTVNLVTFVLSAPDLIQIFVRIALIESILLSLITYWWKISFHSAFFSFFATSMFFLYGSGVLFLFLLLPLIGWSRVRLNKHTPAQIVAGAVISCLVTYLMFRLNN